MDKETTVVIKWELLKVSNRFFEYKNVYFNGLLVGRYNRTKCKSKFEFYSRISEENIEINTEAMIIDHVKTEIVNWLEGYKYPNNIY